MKRNRNKQSASGHRLNRESSVPEIIKPVFDLAYMLVTSSVLTLPISHDNRLYQIAFAILSGTDFLRS